jgi:hypothetical protein
MDKILIQLHSRDSGPRAVCIIIMLEAEQLFNRIDIVRLTMPALLMQNICLGVPHAADSKCLYLLQEGLL